MRFNPPTKLTFWITVALAIIGVIGALFTIPVLSTLAVWLIVIAYIVLAASLFVKGMCLPASSLQSSRCEEFILGG